MTQAEQGANSDGEMGNGESGNGDFIITINPLTARVVWGATDDFKISFLHFSLFSIALWDLANSRPVHSLMLSSHLFRCLPCLLLPFILPCKMVLARPDERET